MVIDGYSYDDDVKQVVNSTADAVDDTVKLRGLTVIADVLQVHPSDGTLPEGSFFANGIRMTTDGKPCTTTTIPAAVTGRMANGLLVNQAGEIVVSATNVVAKIAHKTPLGIVQVDAIGALVVAA